MATYYKRELAGDVRDLTLREIKKVLLDDKCEFCTKEFRQQLILRLAGSVLPRLQEHTGEDGAAIPIAIYGGLSKHNGDKEGVCSDQKDKSGVGGNVGEQND